MTIHVVQEGDTIRSIAQKYGVQETRIIQENEIANPNELVIGETLVILIPKQIHIVQEGDTLADIAFHYGVTVMELLRNNPYLSEREYIYPGETIVISYKDIKHSNLSTNGYAFPFIDREVLKKTLPFLTYLTIYSYMFTAEGELNDIDDEELVQDARTFGVAPIMLLTPNAKSDINKIDIIHDLLLSKEKQDIFINNVLNMLKFKGYYGVNISTPYIFPQDRDQYIVFIEYFTSQIVSKGFIAFDTLNLTPFEVITSTLYKGLDYKLLADEVSGVVLISYESGYVTGTPSGMVPFDSMKKFLEYTITQVPSEKLFLGLYLNGYVWEFPYESDITKGLSISYNSAIEMAYDCGAEILYDTITRSSHFQCIRAQDEYIVRFRDARGIYDYLKLISDHKLYGAAIWNIMLYLPQLWLIANSQYEIDKVI